MKYVWIIMKFYKVNFKVINGRIFEVHSCRDVAKTRMDILNANSTKCRYRMIRKTVKKEC